METHSVESALVAISSGVADFKSDDTRFGNSLARQVLKGQPLTPRQYARAYDMLQNYRDVLQAFGIDYDAIPVPTIAPTKTTTKPRVVHFRGGSFLLSFPYIPLIADAVKLSFKGALWDADNRVWIVSGDQAAEVGKFCIEHKFKPTEQAMEQFAAVAVDDEPPSTDLSHTPTWRLSWAIDSDIEVEVPEGLKLHGFQKADIEYVLDNLRPRKGVYLGDEMGLGKSPQGALTLKEKQAYPAMIGMPRVVWLKWAKELQTWTPGLRVVLLAGSIVSLKTRLIAHRFGAEIVKFGQPIPEADVYLIKYSVLYKWTKPVARKVGTSKYKKTYTATGPLKDLAIKGVIFDEAHYLKDEKSQRTRAALALVTTLKPVVPLNASGTPFLNRHIELLSQLKLIGRLQDVAKDDWDFMNLFCNKYGYGQKGPFGYYEFDGSVNGDLLNHRLRANGILAQHEKQDRVIEGVHVPGVLRQLPKLRPVPVPAELTNEARYWKVHNELKDRKRDLHLAIKRLKSAVAKKTPATQLSKLRGQMKTIENQVGVLSNEAWMISGEEKVKFTIEWVQTWLESSDPSEKLIVFGHHRIVNEAIAKHFDAPLIYGDQSDSSRQDAEDAFQEDPAVRIVVCQIKSANIGINLTAATALVFAELPFVPGDIDQAIGRAYGRLNDVHGVSVYFLVYYGPEDHDPDVDGKTSDEHILEDILHNKRSIFRTGISGSRKKVSAKAS